LGDDVEFLIGHIDIELYLGIGFGEARQKWSRQEMLGDRGNCQPQMPAWTLAQAARSFGRSAHLGDGGRNLFMEAFAGLGQADAAGRASDQRGAQSLFKPLYRLTHRRAPHAEARGSRAYTPSLRDQCEHGKSIELHLHLLAVLSTVRRTRSLIPTMKGV